MDLKTKGYEGVEWVDLDQDMVKRWTIVNIESGGGNLLTSWATFSFSAQWS